jgi:CheY-like chemotaxis protein
LQVFGDIQKREGLRDRDARFSDSVGDLLLGVGVASREGRVALRLFEGASYDLILADYRMPGMDGLELLEALRERDPGMEGRFVFATADILSSELRKVTEGRGIPVLLKPFDLDELVGAVRARLPREGG